MSLRGTQALDIPILIPLSQLFSVRFAFLGGAALRAAISLLPERGFRGCGKSLSIAERGASAPKGAVKIKPLPQRLSAAPPKNRHSKTGIEASFSATSLAAEVTYGCTAQRQYGI
jgi:hypothetical protein